MNRIQTRALVEGAVFAAITVIIGIIRFYIPFIALISIFWSVPAILIAFRHGFKVSTLSVVVSSVLVGVMTQPIEGLGFFIGFGLPGIIMGFLLQKKLSPGKTIFITGLVLAVCSVASIYLGMLVIGTDIREAYDKIFLEVKNAYNDVLNTMVDTYSMMGVNKEELLKGLAGFEKSLELMKLIVPGGLLVSGILLSFVNFKLTKLVLKRINYNIEDVLPFSLWRLSNKGMLLIASTVLYVIVELYMIRLPQLYGFTMNIFTIAVFVFTVLGLSTAKFFLDKYKVPKAVKGIILFFLLVSFSNITMLVGVFDMLFDFRKLRSEPARGV